MDINWKENYNEQEIKTAKSYSPATERYLNLLSSNIKGTNSFYQKTILQRHKSWTNCSLAQINSRRSTQDICKYWSLSTKELLKIIWEKLDGNESLALFALGKLGAMELNLSSDIDILIVSQKPANKENLKFYKEFNEFLSSHSEFGFCYRLDYNLRPGGRLGPVICSTSQFEDYYWTQGATWERVALNRLSPVCGNSETIRDVLEIKKSFCYRKFLDYSVLEDIKNIRRHIQFEYGNKEDSINLKLNIGGIRDIELYINSLQVIHGGKVPELQVTETSLAIELLKKHDLLEAEDSIFLNETYWYFRRLENLIQSQHDLQTHKLEKRFLLPSGNQVETKSLPFKKIDAFVSILIGTNPTTPPPIPNSLDQQISWLVSKGFDKKTVHKVWPELMKLTVYAKNNQADEILRSRFLFNFIENVCQFGLDKDLSLNLLFEFIKSIRPKRSFYHLLEKEPNIVKELSILLSSSPFLGQLLTSKPELLDSFLLKQSPEFSHDLDSLLPQLNEYKQLNQLLLSGQLLTNKNIDNLTYTCSITADKIAGKLLSCLKKSFPNNSIDIIQLGKWGGHDLGLLSDLDFIFVTSNELTEDDIKISRRFINLLTNQQRGGETYKVDLRLRPQSGSGALISTKENLLKYISNEAKAWERQSYLRSHTMLDTNFKEKISDSIYNRPISLANIKEMDRIKHQLFAENLKTSNSNKQLNLKYSPGALIDIEFSVQICFLKNMLRPKTGNTLEMILQLPVSTINSENKKLLHKNYLKLRYYEQISQILSQHQSTTLNIASDSFKRLSKHLSSDSTKLFSSLSKLLTSNKEILEVLYQ